VNAPISLNSQPRLEDFPFRVSDNVRFADLDPQHHVNNAVFASYFETGRVTLIRNPEYGLMPKGLSWMLVRLDITFKSEIRWPGTIDLGLGVGKIGRSSVSYSQAVFSGGVCAASAEAVTVLVDQATRKPIAVPADIIAKFSPWMMRETESVPLK
jgi:acyl-CoA thioester hydrolase